MDALPLLAALGMMCCVILAKLVTGRLVGQMKSRIDGVAQQKQETLNQLRVGYGSEAGG